MLRVTRCGLRVCGAAVQTVTHNMNLETRKVTRTPYSNDPYPATRNAQLATRNSYLLINLQSEIPNPKSNDPYPETRNAQRATRNSQRATRNPYPATTTPLHQISGGLPF